MSRIFATGSTEGLGRAAAQRLIEEGHQVVLHARAPERTASLDDQAGHAAGIVVGDLASELETRRIVDQLNKIGRMDAVIHNAGVYLTSRGTTPEGHAGTFAVNVLAPYLLTVLIEQPSRLVYLSSSMHRGCSSSLNDIDWVERRWDAAQAYSESKLYLTALALSIARRWPAVLSNAVDPGWVPTRMGGAGAPDDLEMGYLTQTWLAVSNDPAAASSGGYWYHRQRQTPAANVSDSGFQDRLIDKLGELTGVPLD
ncbi:SDR family oxidoreductase [Paraburkholderia sp. SIMBA_049]